MWLYYTGVLLLVLVVCVVVTLRYIERSMIYLPRALVETHPEEGSYEDARFITEDGRLLHGWWFPSGNARGTIIACHGNVGNISTRLWLVEEITGRMRCNLFLFDYRGFGQSAGFPCEKGLRRDASAAYEYVRAKYEDADDPPVIVFGLSLGGAVAIQLALDRPVRGLVVQASFTSILAMNAYRHPWLPARFLIRDRYESLEKIGKIEAPVLIAHGKNDQVIPYEMGEALFAAAREPKTFFTHEEGHSEEAWGYEGYPEAFSAFVDRCLDEPG